MAARYSEVWNNTPRAETLHPMTLVGWDETDRADHRCLESDGLLGRSIAAARPTCKGGGRTLECTLALQRWEQRTGVCIRAASPTARRARVPPRTGTNRFVNSIFYSKEDALREPRCAGDLTPPFSPPAIPGISGRATPSELVGRPAPNARRTDRVRLGSPAKHPTCACNRALAFLGTDDATVRR